MKARKQRNEDLSRRDFIKTTAVGVGATALAGLGATEANAQSSQHGDQLGQRGGCSVVGYGGLEPWRPSRPMMPEPKWSSWRRRPSRAVGLADVWSFHYVHRPGECGRCRQLSIYGMLRLTPKDVLPGVGEEYRRPRTGSPRWA